ncbi:LOW QUALITY PROTEIN: pentatricopeptide repeat-containing protein At1g10910, chloroplastic-like [Actinidia eriantha]|uniref:LOW QUALITY PROTEIN: pentatricopeptide repeat-containing protein At1g10910, chloroplastic-like n=1 Tax=Actinidia eriantha TaxID=165200 RepID=UPI00258D3CAD|nr:LOW QUALITY PROTEIN: pentatricopeptide repeat-containing protein At1g10910, chloroplastic-like [Actinidia eriantha]
MELSSVFANRFHPIFATQSPPKTSYFSLYPPLSPTARSIKDSSSTSATSATLHSEPQSRPTNVSQKPLSISYSARQSAIIDIQQSTDLDSALVRSGGMLKVQDLNIILRHFGKLNRWQELSQLYDWMQKNGRISISSYSSYIKFIGNGLNPVKALEIYNNIDDELTRNNVSVCNSVLSCLVRSGKFESSIRLFHQMKKDGLKPDVVTYTTLLSGCTKVKNGYSKAIDLVQELNSSGLHMDSIIYGTLLAVCASNNQCNEAEKYFNQMKDEGHSPNVYHYSSLLNAYSVDGNYEKADMLVQDMKSAGLVPNKVILTTLLKVYVRGGLFGKSREILTELEALGYAKDEMPYCLLMDGLAKAGQILEAKSVFDEMKKKDVTSDGYSHSIMISAFCRSGLFEEAKQLACDFEATYDKYDLVIMNTMLCAYCRAGEMECVMKLMRKMDELAISPDWNTFHILIKYFCKEKLYLLAYRTMEDMHKKGHQPEEELCSSLIFHLGKTDAASEAYSVYNMLRYSKRTMHKALHEKILHILIKGRLFKDAYVVIKDNAKLISQPAMKKFATSFLKSGNINLLNDVVRALHSSGYKFDQELFHMAISRYIAQPEKKNLLLQLLQWMPGQGYVVDSSTRNLILKNSDLFGRQLTAEILSKQHMVSKALSSGKRKDK